MLNSWDSCVFRQMAVDMQRSRLGRCNVQRDVENSLPGQLFTHFGLQENPFGVTPDIRFLYQSHTHREALTSLINGIDFGFGFQVLIGQPGMGKTSLLFSLLERFRTDAHTAFVFQPQNEPHDLLQSVLYELGTSSTETSLHRLFEQVNDVLYRAAQERKRVILVVDEAQNLEYVVLEALRQLSNFETPDSKLLQVVLAGQPQLAERLAAGAHEQLRQRISAVSRLRPLALDETAAYINHRLATAGYGGANLFTEGGVRLIWNHSKGVPRNINTLCFGAMMLGFAERAKSVDEHILEEAARALDLNCALADVLAMEPPVAVTRGNGRVEPSEKTTPAEAQDAGAIANEEPVASAGSVSHEAGTTGERNPAAASEYVPPSVVEALARITQALEEQRLLLMANSDASSQQQSVLRSASPVIPLYYAAAENEETRAGSENTAGVLPLTAIESSAVAAIPSEHAPKPEVNSLSTTAEKEPPAEPKLASVLPEHEGKDPVEHSLMPVPAPAPGYPRAAKKPSKGRIVRTKALSLAAFAGILLLMLFEKFPLHLGAVKAGVRGQSAVAQAPQPAGYSVSTGSPASLEIGASSPGKNPSTDLHPPQANGSDQSRDVVVRRFSTDLSVTKKTPDNRQELRRVFFNEDSDLIDAQYRPWLQQLADALAKDPTATVRLEGHTDTSGGEAHNLQLSSRRAIAVRNILVSELHVPKTRLTTTGVGSEAPLQPNSTATGRAYNRRVEVRLTHSSD
jgi:type II secretory pathway predicted ATPase ExeA/outer membrane protein OmpA-like peptidoglycan-associated protein